MKVMTAERLLRIVGPLHIAGGLLLFLTVFVPAVSTWLNEAFGIPSDHPWSQFFIPIFGPTVASWGVLFTAIARQYFRQPVSELWWSMVLSIAVWAPLDTGICIVYGLWPAAGLNILVIVFLLALLLRVRPGLVPANPAKQVLT